MADATPRFVLVKSTSPYNRGDFGRAGLRFTRDWRPLEVGTVANLEKGVIDAEVLKRLESESFLAVKPATAEEVAKFSEAMVEASKDPSAALADLAARNAELEARLMRLELGAGAASKPDEKRPGSKA